VKVAIQMGINYRAANS